MRKQLLFCLIILGTLTALAFANNLSLPPYLELVSSDSSYITVRNKESGLISSFWLDGEPQAEPGWDMDTSRFHAIADSISDTCFHFEQVGTIRRMGLISFGDANRNGMPEIVGHIQDRQYFYEYSGHDTTYNLLMEMEPDGTTAYGQDTDSDGKLEMITSRAPGLVLYESPDSFSLPADSVFLWPRTPDGIIQGTFSDLNGDGQTEISLRPDLMRINALRNIGDNQYELAYSIVSPPESLQDNYYNYIWGDMDNDGRSEVLTTGSMGTVLEFENVAPDSFAFVWMAHVRYWNTFWIAGPTDFDRDGRRDYVVMSKSVSRGGFFFDWFESTGDNQYEKIYSDSLPGDVWSSVGDLRVFDIDNDGIDELLVCSGYWRAIYKSFSDDSWEPIYLWQVNGDRIPVYDVNNDGYGEIIAGRNILSYTPGRDIFADANCDCQINMLDVTYLVNYFKGEVNYLPRNRYLVDVNGNCQVNGLDVTYFVNYFKGGPALIRGNCN